jgi:hypothetical protein
MGLACQLVKNPNARPHSATPRQSRQLWNPEFFTGGLESSLAETQNDRYDRCDSLLCVYMTYCRGQCMNVCSLRGISQVGHKIADST